MPLASLNHNDHVYTFQLIMSWVRAGQVFSLPLDDHNDTNAFQLMTT